MLICSPDHPFSQYQSISLKKLASQPFVSFQQDIPTRKAIDAILKQHGVPVIIKAEFDNIELIKRAVEIVLGVSVVPSTTVKSETEAGILRALSLTEGPFTHQIPIIYWHRRALPPGVKKLISVLTGSDS